MRIHKILWLALPALILAVCATGQTTVDLKTQSRSVNFSSSSYTIPNKTGSTLPGTCQEGETFLLTTGTTGLYGCLATNTWTLLGGSASVLTDLTDVTAKQGTSTVVQMASGATSADTVLKSSSDGSAVASGCTETDGDMICPGFSTSGTDTGVITLGEGVAPSTLPGTGERDLYFDSSDGKLKSRNSAGDVAAFLTESRTLTGGAGIAAIGNMSADRTIRLDFAAEAEAAAPLASDWVLVESNATPGSFSKVKLSHLPDCMNPSNFCLFEDFGSGHLAGGNLGLQGWTYGGDSGYTITFQNGESGAPGIVRMETGTTAGQHLYLKWAGGGSPFADAGSSAFELTCRTKAGSTTDAGVSCGITNSDYFGGGSDRVAAYWDSNAGGNWTYEVCGGGACSNIDSGVTAMTGWQRPVIHYDGSGTYTFSMHDSSGNLVSGSTKTLCTAGSGCDVTGITLPLSSSPGRPAVIVITRTSAARSADVDFFSLKMTGMSR